MKSGNRPDKMTLDEAIKHAEEVFIECNIDNPKCAEDHLQLVNWLKELKKYKKYYGEISE